MIRIINNALPDDLIGPLSAYIRGASYKHGWKSTTTASTAHWNAPFTATVAPNNRQNVEDTLSAHPLVQRAWHHAQKSYLPGAILLRAYANLMTYGQDGQPHKDSPTPGDVTLLFYMNPEWHADWAGETCFFDENGDTEQAVLPKLNRLVIFPSEKLHAARGIYPTTPIPRVILVFKASMRRS